MNVFTKMGVVAIALIVAIVLYFFYPRSSLEGAAITFEKTILAEKPDLSGSVISNPDLIYDDYGCIGGSQPGDACSRFLEIDTWDGNGFYDNDTIDGRFGYIVLHPIDEETPRYMETALEVPEGDSKLVVGASNIVGKVTYTSDDYIDSEVYDVFLNVVVADSSTGNVYSDSTVLYGDDGWKDIQYDMSGFSGREVTIRIEGFDEDSYENWAGEWAAVDYVGLI